MKRTTTLAVSGLLLALALVLGNAPAEAAMFCGPRQDMAEHLVKDLGEVPAFWGLVGNSHLIEVFVATGGDFTILITRPDGLSCVMAAGENWQALRKPRKGGA